MEKLAYMRFFSYLCNRNKIYKVMEEELTCFEVETTYKSGRKKNEVIVSKDEESMWRYYDKHHNKNLVASSVIVDAWGQ